MRKSWLFLCLTGCTAGLHPAAPPAISKAPLVNVSEDFSNGLTHPVLGHYERVDWATLPGWSSQDVNGLKSAVNANCRALQRPLFHAQRKPAQMLSQQWATFCRVIRSIPQSQLLSYFQQHLQAWKLNQSVLATGYYEPLVEGRLQRDARFRWPLYAKPADLLDVHLSAVEPGLIGKRVRGKLQGHKIVPYDTRAEYEKRPNPPVVAWLDDPVEAYFLQIQGSGKIQLPHGKMLQLSYAGHNGRPYTSIGKILVQTGQLSISQASKSGIQKWAKLHPTQWPKLLHHNESLVFFQSKAITATTMTGPVGAFSVPLQAQRSIAVDPRYIPLGAMVYLATTQPNSTIPLYRVMFAQDTGTAIKGAGRIDYFWGTGLKAGLQAGKMKQGATLWVLLPQRK